METVKFPICCGAQILKNFPYGDRFNPVRGARRRRIEQKTAVGQWLRKQKTRHSGKAILVLTLNGGQKSYLGPTMARNGFKVMGSGFNRAHGSTIYLYAYFNQRVELKQPREGQFGQTP